MFDRVASITGRKPNSIRNYYYLKIKEEGSPLSTTFIPFPKEETEELIHDMLKGQAEGRSVRSMAMEMGGGDKKLMLRYQNKYRSTIKNNEELTRSVMERMEQNLSLIHILQAASEYNPNTTPGSSLPFSPFFTS